MGHTEEYFVKHTKKLVVYIIMPRVQKRSNLLRIYTRGTLTKELAVWSSGNFFLYYASWLFHYWKFILTYFGRNEQFLMFSGHPISFFGMTVQKLLRQNIRFAYWIGDYYPPVNWQLILFEKIKKFYHDRVDCHYYLSDTINKIFNEGRVMDSLRSKTVMWGVKPVSITKRLSGKQLNILFVGLVKEDQGIEVLLSFLAKHPDYALKIIGICHGELFKKYQTLIEKYRISNRVFFPNKFYSDTELESVAKDCHVGIALYDTGKLNATYYTDPGKVKTYIEMGLPVVMSNTSGIARYIRKYKAGEVIGARRHLPEVLSKIKRDYQKYQHGLVAFTRYFDYERYYKSAFMFLEDILKKT